MRARAILLFATWLIAASLLSFRGLPSGPVAQSPVVAQVLAPVQAPPAPKPFSHAQHVPQAWLDLGQPEVFRDCRGCHRFDATHAVSSPQQECGECHIGGGKLTPAFAAGFAVDLAGYRTRTLDAFRHHTHGMLECRECHAPEFSRSRDPKKAGVPRFDNLFEHFELQTGPGQCARCHAGGADPKSFRLFEGIGDPAVAAALGQQPFRLPGDLATYASKTLVEVFAGPGGGLNKTPLPVGGEFVHGDHLLIACKDCHRDVEAAKATAVGTGDIPLAKCADCHVTDAQRTPVRAASTKKQVTRPLWSLGTFAHADHYAFVGKGKRPGISNAAGYAAIEKQGCAACHTYTPEAPGRAGRDFPFDNDAARNRYADCERCHDADGWRTGETAAAPLHSSNGGDGWKRCDACHVIGQPDLAHVRPQVAVARHREHTFVFPANTHPDITRQGIDKSGRPALEECTTCHRARVPALTTRLEQAKFRHRSHLAPDASPLDCLACHPAAGTATNAADLGGANMRTYTLATCGKCHWGGDVTEAETAAAQPPVKASVVAFPHGPHVTQAKQSCLECHAPAADGRSVETKTEAIACNKCHDHKEGGPKAEGLFGTVTSCARCHPLAGGRGDVPDVPPVRGSALAAADARYQAQQSLFPGFADAQFHPLGAKCADCHRANASDDGFLAGIVFAGSNHLSASHDGGSVHGKAGSKEPSQCLRCHWTPTTGAWEAAVNGAEGAPEQHAFRRTPASKATRERFGNDAAGYPGSERANG